MVHEPGPAHTKLCQVLQRAELTYGADSIEHHVVFRGHYTVECKALQVGAGGPHSVKIHRVDTAEVQPGVTLLACFTSVILVFAVGILRMEVRAAGRVGQD